MTGGTFKRIMIFGTPGSGKTTFAKNLAHSWDLPLYHLDAYFFIENWVERDAKEFLEIQLDIVSRDRWVVDGNSTRSLEMRWARADLVLYFKFPRTICFYRVIKRFLRPPSCDDRAPGCPERIRLRFFSYIWGFEKRVARDIQIFRERYPQAVFKEVRDKNTLCELIEELGVNA